MCPSPQLTRLLIALGFVGKQVNSFEFLRGGDTPIRLTEPKTTCIGSMSAMLSDQVHRWLVAGKRGPFRIGKGDRQHSRPMGQADSGSSGSHLHEEFGVCPSPSSVLSPIVIDCGEGSAECTSLLLAPKQRLLPIGARAWKRCEPPASPPHVGDPTTRMYPR